MNLLKEAQNQMAYFKAGLLGFPGSGKTFTATLLAQGICKAIGNNKIAYFDTETGSDFLIGRLKADGHQVFQVKSRAFGDLLGTIREAESGGIGVLIIDSITHVWRDLCDSYDKRLNRRGRLQFQDWAVLKKEWKQYTDAFVNGKVHIIVCGRAGYEYDYDFNEDGSKDLIKTDIKMKVESEFGFEPSLVVLMERTSQNKENIKEHLGKADRKSKAAKAQHQPTVGSKWIHRAHVLKDRTDTLNGQIFDYPTFNHFAPHFKALNIGGDHLGVDTSRNSEDRFDANGKPGWKKDQERATIALEEIEGAIVQKMPGQTTVEKKAKVNLVVHVFQTASWTAIKGMKHYELNDGLKRIRAILDNPENTPKEMSEGNFTEPEPDNGPLDTSVFDPQPQQGQDGTDAEQQSTEAVTGDTDVADQGVTEDATAPVEDVQEGLYTCMACGGQFDKYGTGKTCPHCSALNNKIKATADLQAEAAA